MDQINSNGRYSVLGSSGSGKSNLVFLLLEELRSRRQPIAIIDKKGEYSDLPGMYYVNPSVQQPKGLPFKLRESNASVVIDMRLTRTPEAWVRDFVTTCLKVKRKVPLLVVIEEAHNYCPQRGRAVSKKAINKLAAEGRSQGYGFMLVSQRCAKLDKDALDESEYLLLLRHNFPKDTKYLEGIIGKDQAEKNRGLSDGEVQLCHLKTLQFNEPEQVPLAQKKRSGHTPQAVSVDVDEKALMRPYRGSAPKGKLIAPDDTLIYIGVVIVFAMFVVLAFFIWKGLEAEDRELRRSKGWDQGSARYA